MRRILTIIAIVIVLLGVGIGIYYFFFADGSATLTVGDGAANPFGGAGDGSGTTPGGAAAGGDADGSAGGDTSAVAAQPSPRLVEVAAGPVAEGAAMVRIIIPAAYGAPAGSSTVPTVITATTTDIEERYIDRASGNVYAYRVHGNSLVRTSNRTIPGVQQASWLADGSMAYARFVTTSSDGTMHADGYALPANGIGGFALPEDLAQAFAVASSSLFTLSSGTNGSVGTVSKADGTGGKTVFSSALGQIAVSYSKAGYFAATKPSADADGYAFSVGSTGSFTRIAGPLRGLSILPNHAGTKILMSYVAAGTLKLAAYDAATRTLTALPVSTLAEKCVWAPDDENAYCGVPVALPSATLPDDWYQGAALFSDRIWKIDFDSRVAELVANLPTLAKTDIDATALTIDQDQDVLTFVNKRDGSFWSYDL